MTILHFKSNSNKFSLNFNTFDNLDVLAAGNGSSKTQVISS